MKTLIILASVSQPLCEKFAQQMFTINFKQNVCLEISNNSKSVFSKRDTKLEKHCLLDIFRARNLFFYLL